MANEVNQLTINAAGDSWVDSIPSAISTGYQAQNTNIQAHSVGQDLSSVRVSGTDVIVDISGPIDVDGIPFSVTSAVTLTPSSGGVQYIQIVAGATSTQKSLELTTSTPVWDASKNGLYNGANRVLNWVVYCYPNTLKILKLSDAQYSNASLGAISETYEINGFVRWADMAKFIYSQYISNFSATSPRGVVIADGDAITTATTNTTVYIHDGLTGTISGSFTNPSGNNGSSLGFDGLNLIIGTETNIYLQSGITSTTTSSFSYNGYGGVAWDGTNLISLTTPGGTLSIHDGFSATILSSVSIGGSTQYNGIGFDGKHILVNDGAAGAIRFYDHSSLEYLGAISSSTNYYSAAYYDKKLFRADQPSGAIRIYGISL